MNEPTLQVNQITANAADRRVLDGREYAVVPAVALVAGVVNGQLAPTDEVAKYLDAWNGRPLPVRHPRKNGKYVSANQPDIIANQVIGQFFNANLVGDRLLGELWIDVAKAQQLGGDALTVLQRLETGQPVEVSTAYYSDLEAGTGSYNGKQYAGIQRNFRPDHIALLPDELGACSWKDGCGAPRVNCACAENQSEGGVSMSTNATVDVPVDGAEDELDVVIDGAAGEVTPPAQATTDAQAPAPAPVTNRAQALPPEIVELQQVLAELGGASQLRSLLGGLRANADRERAEIVGRLVANQACAFSRDDLGAMTVDQLQKLERSLTPASYVGRAGGGLSTNQRDEEWTPYQRPQASAA